MRQSSLTWLLSAFVLTTLPHLACKKASHVPAPTHQSASTLLSRAEKAIAEGKWEEARRLLRLIEEQYPSSPEFPTAKLRLGDTFFFQKSPSYPEALVEYQSFLNYFPRYEKRDLVRYRIAQCHYASIESPERDQTETRRAIDAFQGLLVESPASPYAVDAKDKILHCWRRLSDHELVVGIQYVNSYHFASAEKRLKQSLETYPEYADRERTYFYLGEAMRQKTLPQEMVEQYERNFLSKAGKDYFSELTPAEKAEFKTGMDQLRKEEIAKYREEAKFYYQKLVESYPQGEWVGRAKDRLLEMGQAGVKEELDS